MPSPRWTRLALTRTPTLTPTLTLTLPLPLTLTLPLPPNPEQRVREIWGKGGGKESKGTEAQERQASVLGGGFSM